MTVRGEQNPWYAKTHQQLRKEEQKEQCRLEKRRKGVRNACRRYLEDRCSHLVSRLGAWYRSYLVVSCQVLPIAYDSENAVSESVNREMIGRPCDEG